MGCSSVHGRVVVFLATTLLVGCEGGDRTRNQARSFLALYGAIDYAAPAPRRAEKLALIERALLTEPEINAVRDVCVAGHKELIAQQHAQESTASEIDRAIAGAPDGQPLPAATIEALQKRLTLAQAGLQRARTQLEDCESRARSLELRFGQR